MPVKAYQYNNKNKGNTRRFKNNFRALSVKNVSPDNAGKVLNSTLKEACIFESSDAISPKDFLSNFEMNSNSMINASPALIGVVRRSTEQIISTSGQPMRKLLKVIVKSNTTARGYGKKSGFSRGYTKKITQAKLTDNGELIIHVSSPIVRDEDNNISFLKETRVGGTNRRRGFDSLPKVTITPEVVKNFPHHTRDKEKQKRTKKIKENFEISSKLAIKLRASLADDSQLKKLSVDEINKFFHKTFFISLGFYQSLIVRNGIKKYYIYENNEFSPYIDMLISKKFLMKITYKRYIYDMLCEELFDFLQNRNIQIGKFGKLIVEKKNIAIEVNKDLKISTKMTPVKSKKLRFKKNEK